MKRAGYSSKYRGVSWHKGHNKWRAEVRMDGKKVYLGHFDDEAEAALAYDVYVAKVKKSLGQAKGPLPTKKDVKSAKYASKKQQEEDEGMRGLVAI